MSPPGGPGLRQAGRGWRLVRFRALLFPVACGVLGVVATRLIVIPQLQDWSHGIPPPGLMARLGAAASGEAGSGAQTSTYETLTVFHNALGLIREHYLTEVEPEWVMDGAVRGIFRALDDDSAYLTAEEAALFRRRSELDGDVGITLEKRYYLHVDGVLPGSPASSGGIEEGAAITEIAGQSTREMQIPVGRLLLAGPPDSEVSLSVRNSADTRPAEIRLVRSRPDPVPVEHRVLEPGIGWIRILRFHPGTAGQVAAAVAALEGEGVDALVLDVRNSRGAENYVGPLREVAGTFLGDVVVALLRGRTDEGEEPADRLSGIPNPVSWNGALTVLANRSTAGPGELLAAAVVSQDRGSFVGSRTAGRTGAPELIELPAGDAILLTVRQFLDPDGGELLGTGAVPSVTPGDLELDVSTLDDEDPELDFALRHIRAERGEQRKAA